MTKTYRFFSRGTSGAAAAATGTDFACIYDAVRACFDNGKILQFMGPFGESGKREVNVSKHMLDGKYSESGISCGVITEKDA